MLIGDVIVGPRCYIGPAACLRGDFGRIDIRAGANIQDTCVLHAFPGHDAIVEEDGHIGHGAVLHGCIVERNALVGMNAVINDNAVIGESAIVAAMAFVKAGMVVPPRTLVAGIPARVVRTLTEMELAWKQEGTASYHDLTRRSMLGMKATLPLPAPEANRKAARSTRDAAAVGAEGAVGLIRLAWPPWWPARHDADRRRPCTRPRCAR